MLGKALKLLRLYHDLSQAEVAVLIGVTKPYVSEIETGKKIPSLQVIEDYADAFEIPMSSLMFFVENLESGQSVELARGVIAEKVLSILEFVAQKGRLGYGKEA